MREPPVEFARYAPSLALGAGALASLASRIFAVRNAMRLCRNHITQTRTHDNRTSVSNRAAPFGNAYEGERMMIEARSTHALLVN